MSNVTSSTSPAIAKAKLLTQLLNEATRSSVGINAHAVLAHLVADAWPTGSTWTASTAITTLANRLAVSYDTVARAVRELEEAELVRRQVGGGQRNSRYVFIARSEPVESAGVPPQRPHGCGPTLRTGADSESARVRTIPGFQNSTSSSRGAGRSNTARLSPGARRADSPAAAGAAGSGADRGAERTVEVKTTIAARTSVQPQPLPTPVDEAAIAELVRRPEWLPEGKGWIDRATAIELLSLPTTTYDAHRWALELARQRRNTLDNPAGYYIAKLRSPDLAEVEAKARTRHRLAAAATQHSHAVNGGPR